MQTTSFRFEFNLNSAPYPADSGVAPAAGGQSLEYDSQILVKWIWLLTGHRAVRNVGSHFAMAA